MRLKFAIGMSVFGAALLAPAGASAAISCDLTGTTLTVSISAGTTQVTVEADAAPSPDEILVKDGFFGSLQACAGTQATVTNTDAVNVVDGVSGQNTIVNLGLAAAPLEPGATPEGAGTSEIEFTFSAGDGTTDDLQVFGNTTLPDNYRFGAQGATAVGGDLNSDGDVNDVTVNEGERLDLTGGLDNDVLDASGGSGFTGPVGYNGGGSSVLHLAGMGDDDQLVAGSGGWHIDGGGGNDAETGGAGIDEILMGDSGNDTADGGGGGSDFANYQFSPVGSLTVDLRISGIAQNTGVSGSDTISNFESIVGSQSAGGVDVLIGDNGPNSIFANAGDDVLVGLGGNDTLAGNAGVDTVSYADGSTGPVTLSLGTPMAQATGGAGTDTLTDVNPAEGLPDIENIVGSPFMGDNLTGNGLNNRIDVLDGLFDIVDCVDPGGDADTAIADEPGVDMVSIANCELIDTAPQTSIDMGPTNGSTTADTTPSYNVSANEASNFQYKVDAGTFQACTASTCTTTALSDGTHTISIRAIDQGPNTLADQTPASRQVTIDSTPPNTIASGPAKLKLKKKKKTASATYTLTSTEAGASFQCSLDGAAFASCPATHRLALRKGSHTLTVRATDAAGNVDTSPATVTTRVVKRKKPKR